MPLLKWYLEHGLEVSRIYRVIEFTPTPCFESFTRDITEARRSGDIDPSKSIIADTMKLLGNSAYGSLIMDKSKFQTVKYVKTSQKAKILANNRRFRRMNELDDEVYEAELAKSRISLNLPMQAGFFILQLAKLRMLEFYYDVLDYYVDRKDFELCTMDTDSNYIAFSADSLESVIKPHLREEFFRNMHKWFPTHACEKHRSEFVNVKTAGGQWIPSECCLQHFKREQRTPGLFKIEYQGDAIISLCSKTYCIENWEENKAKFSSKGISKRGFSNPMNIYREVLTSKIPASGTNKGFRAKDNGIYTYEQVRSGFSYLYCKRLVADDGISTRALDIELNPWAKSDNGAGSSTQDVEDAEYF